MTGQGKKVWPVHLLMVKVYLPRIESSSKMEFLRASYTIPMLAAEPVSKVPATPAGVVLPIYQVLDRIIFI